MRSLKFSLYLTLVTILSTSWSAQSQIVYDTVSIKSIGPGILHYRIVAPSMPWNINVLQINLKNPYVSFETVKANDRLAGYEVVSSMAKRKSRPGRVAVGAINGDFYSSGGIPTHIQISQGEVLLRPISRPAVGFDTRNAPMIDAVTLSLKAMIDDAVATVHGINATRQTNQLILYNSSMGPTTGTNQFGTEALLRPVTPWIVNDTVVCVVESIEQRIGNMAIPKGWAILSGHGLSESTVMSRLQRGDSIRLGC